MKIFPSLISADVLNLQRTIDLLDPHVDGYHLDIMDDHFVPNLTFGPMVVNAVASVTQRTLWVHVMADHVLSLIERINMPAGSLFTFHVETQEEIPFIIQQLRAKQWKVGLAISPQTPTHNLSLYLGSVDHILIMSVNPGFAGQKFIHDTLAHADWLNDQRQKHNYSFELAFDGGINAENMDCLKERTVTMIAVAKAIFAQQDIVMATKKLRDKLNN